MWASPTTLASRGTGKTIPNRTHSRVARGMAGSPPSSAIYELNDPEQVSLFLCLGLHRRYEAAQRGRGSKAGL